ncbi:hypothetical protein M405DRAFT_830909 [Rhizopogon salebrosus TDB-379]|nr:hypothetical protein M405DRAFT_830909 [Rhizopogon salebrosus TDB-379]
MEHRGNAEAAYFPFALHLVSLPGTSTDVRQSIVKVLPVTYLSHSIFDVLSLPKRRANNEGLTRYYVTKGLLG